MNLDFLSGFDAGGFVRMLLWGVGITAGIITLVTIVRNKLKYAYYGLVLRRRQSSIDGTPQAVILMGKSGYFTKKSGKTVYRIKYGKMPWHIIETSDTPDPQFMLGNMAIFFQLDKDNVLQAKMSVDWKGEGIRLVPVKDDLKFHHRLSMQEIDGVLETRKISPVLVGMMIMGLIIVAGIVVFYFLSQAGK